MRVWKLERERNKERKSEGEMYNEGKRDRNRSEVERMENEDVW